MKENYEKIYRLETTPEALAASAEYLAERLSKIVEKEELVLICFPNSGADSLGAVFADALTRIGARPQFWGPDFTWKELLRTAFDGHIQTIIGHPIVVLGLMKIARATATPLYLRNVILAGYAYSRWMAEGLKRGLDCQVWGCYAAYSGSVIVGFTCNQEAGLHIRDDVFDVVVQDDQGNTVLPPGRGKLFFSYKKAEGLVFDPEETAVIHRQSCSCGNDAPRIVDPIYIGPENPSNYILEKELLPWSSVLDYRVKQTESGVDLEVVVFPGESLPQLPSCAKLLIRRWNPEKDIPFYIADNFMKILEISR